MLLDVCFGTRTAWKILFVLAEAPGKAVTRKEIKLLTRTGNKALTKFLMLLEKFDMVLVTKIGKTHHYKLNMSNPFAEQMTAIIKQEKQTLNNPDFVMLNILRDFVYDVTNLNLDNLQQVILFGSYAKRTNTAGSDIDVALIMKKMDPGQELMVTEIIDAIRKRYKHDIQPHYYTADEFKQQSKLVQEIRKNGIRLI